ncbi:MAG: hypothetical protein BZ151_03035 [Desulfobacca sp. 4484_104]|nr:MAG: hypothetical protein BZ151_03035 [Desulfobacca sp. 4484_104]
MSGSWPVLNEILKQGLRQQVFTAATLLVGLNGELRYEAVVGRIAQDDNAAPVTRDTYFDLASLTKPLATTLALLTLMAQDRLNLETTLGEILTVDWLPPDKQPLTIKSWDRHGLQRSGLYAAQGGDRSGQRPGSGPLLPGADLSASGTVGPGILSHQSPGWGRPAICRHRNRADPGPWHPG